MRLAEPASRCAAQGEDLEARHLLPEPTRIGAAQPSGGYKAPVDNDAIESTAWMIQGCLHRCLGPVFGWLGFSFLDDWWPKRTLQVEDLMLYETQQEHQRHVACIALVFAGGLPPREDLEGAARAFSSRGDRISRSELQAMFYFAGCYKESKEFLSFLAGQAEPVESQQEPGQESSFLIDHLLDTFAAWPSRLAGLSAAGG
ncbi:unnamed protein product [Symbiodinium sp. KB8]|nr:unnamed protein product [Symbiodinium sp. KB8]